MAERSASKRTLACILVGLGALLVVAAILIPTYTVSKLSKTPLDLEITTVANTGPEGADVLDARSLSAPAGKATVDTKVPLISQRFLTVEDPSDSKKMTVQNGQTLRRTDKQGDTGLLSAVVDRVTIDRHSGQPIDDPIGSIQEASDKPGQEVSHTGLQYRFPIGTEKKTYPYFDVTARKSFDINFVDEGEINGTKVYHFSQKVPTTDMSQVVNSPTNKLALPADKWGVPGGAAPITMTRYYSNQRDVWIEPKTGTVIKGEEKPFQYYARAAGTPDVTVLKADLTFDENTIESQIDIAKDNIDKLALYGRILPIVFGILGALLLLAGLLLGLRGGKGPKKVGPVANPTGPNGTITNKVPPAPQSTTPAATGHDWTTDRTEEIPRAGDIDPPTERL